MHLGSRVVQGRSSAIVNTWHLLPEDECGRGGGAPREARKTREARKQAFPSASRDCRCAADGAFGIWPRTRSEERKSAWDQWHAARSHIIRSENGKNNHRHAKTSSEGGGMVARVTATA